MEDADELIVAKNRCRHQYLCLPTVATQFITGLLFMLTIVDYIQAYHIDFSISSSHMANILELYT